MIPQDVIDGYLTTLFGHSEPGDVMHHMLFAATEPGAESGPLGIPKLALTVYAIAPDTGVDCDEFIAKTVAGAVVDAHVKRTEVHFVGLALEVHSVHDDGNEVTKNQARLLRGEHRLQEHPAAVESTILYAACRDGRRWAGMHFLTGPRAGTKDGPNELVGGLRPEDGGPARHLIRAAVGVRL